jgi:glutaredoxin
MTITNGPEGGKAFSGEAGGAGELASGLGGRAGAARRILASVILYTRRDCHLCDAAKGVLDAVRGRAAFNLEVVDVDGDPELRTRFGHDVPVVFVNGRKAFKHRVDAALFEKKVREK